MRTLTAKVYVLQSKGAVRYVGKTNKTLARRLKEHLKEARSGTQNYRLNWLRSLVEPPTIHLITYTPADAWEAVERHWIALAREYGCKLVNATEGGESGSGPKSAETRAKLRASWTVALRARVSAAKRGVSPYPGVGEFLAACNRGRKLSSERCEKIGRGNRGKVRSATARANYRQAGSKRGPSACNTSGFKGVSFHKQSGKWRGRVLVSGQRRHVGSFSRAADAAVAVDAVAAQCCPSGAYLNFPQKGIV